MSAWGLIKRTMDVPLWALVLLVAVTVAIPLLYIAITWDHDVVCNYPMLPAPSDLGTKEFRWRCLLSPMTRAGWRASILHSACPRITLQSPFALLSTDFAKMTTALGFHELKLETLPFIYPQIAASGLMLQLLGNSNFPAAVSNIKMKALTIVQLKPLDMRFRDKTELGADDPNALHCVMVLIEKRFLEDAVEFAIQTDLFSDHGTVWQSTTIVSVPFTQDKLLAPLSASAAQLDPMLEAREFDKLQCVEFACSSHQLREFEEVNVTNLDGSTPKPTITPLMWLVARTVAALQQQKRVPQVPANADSTSAMWCSFVFDETDGAIPIQTAVACETSLSAATEANETTVTKVQVKYGTQALISGFLRSVSFKSG